MHAIISHCSLMSSPADGKTPKHSSLCVFIKLSSSADISTNWIFLLKAHNAVFALSTLRQCFISQSMRWHVLSVLSLLPVADYFLFLPGQHSHINENQNNNKKKTGCIYEFWRFHPHSIMHTWSLLFFPFTRVKKCNCLITH